MNAMNAKRMATLVALSLLLALPAAGFAAEEKPLPKDLPPFGADKPMPVPAIDASKLANGLTVWLVPRPGFPKITAVLAVRGGGAADPKELPGLSELLSDTLTEGTAKSTSVQIRERLQTVGGEIGASASNDAVYLTVGGLASGTDTLLGVLGEVARGASFPQEEVELAKANALQGLQARSAQPEFQAQKAFAHAVFGEHPYHVTAPEPASIEAVTPEILRREYLRRFRPESSLLVVIGAFDGAAARRTIATLFGDWKGSGQGVAPTPDVVPVGGSREIRFVDRPNSVQSVIAVGRQAIRANDPDYYPSVVANTIFGGAFGSRLTKNIREDKGYTYSPGSGLSVYEKGGVLRVQASVRNEVTAASLMEIFYELDRMGTTSPTEEEFSKAKRYQGGLFLLRNQIQGSIATILARNWVNGLPPEELGQFVTKVNAVTVEDVRRVGRKYFTSAAQTVVVVGDASKVKAEVTQFGTVVDFKP